MKRYITVRLSKREAMALLHAAVVGCVGLEMRLKTAAAGTQPFSFFRPNDPPPSYLTEDVMRNVQDLLRSAIGKHHPRTGLP